MYTHDVNPPNKNSLEIVPLEVRPCPTVGVLVGGSWWVLGREASPPKGIVLYFPVIGLTQSARYVRTFARIGKGKFHRNRRSTLIASADPLDGGVFAVCGPKAGGRGGVMEPPISA